MNAARTFKLGAAAAAALILVIAGLSQADRIPRSARVIEVRDGDTIRIRFQNGRTEVVRLIGIDAPEIGDSREDVKFLALISRRFTFHHLFRRDVELTYDREKRDKYGRLLAYVHFSQGLFNEFILEEGFASPYFRYPFRRDYEDRFRNAGRRARLSGRGLWQPEPYPRISVRNTGDHKGELMSVEMSCGEYRRSGSLHILTSPGRELSLLIFSRDLQRFPPPASLVGKHVTATGFIEEYRGAAQMVLYFSRQLDIRKDVVHTLPIGNGAPGGVPIDFDL